MEKASTILKKSLKIFGPKGEHWTKNFFRTGSGRNRKFCALGVLYETAQTSQTRINAKIHIQKAIGSSLVACWNDKKTTKFPEVKAAFLKAIKLAEQQEKGRTRSVRK